MTNRDSVDIVWEEPPTTTRPRTSIWEEGLLPLVDRPGQWARIYEGHLATARGYTSNLNKRRFSIPHPDHEWEFQSRQEKVDGKPVGKIWARYIGPVGATKEADGHEEE